jgi:hypothetical protein
MSKLLKFPNVPGLDMLGRTLHEGDMVLIIGATISHGLDRRIGTVIRFTEQKTTVETTDKWTGADFVTISVQPNHIIKITDEDADLIQQINQ